MAKSKARKKNTSRPPVSKDQLLARYAKAVEKTTKQADSRRLSGEEIDKLHFAALGALAAIRSGYEPQSFNVLAHYYRVATAIAETMNAPEFLRLCHRAYHALHAYYGNDAQVPMPTDLAEAMDGLIAGLFAFLPEVPYGIFRDAEDTSIRLFECGMVSAFMRLEAWEQQAAYDVIHAGHAAPAVAQRYGKTKAEVRRAALMVGAILFSLHGDQKVPFPRELSALYDSRHEYARELSVLYATRDTMAQIEAAAEPANEAELPEARAAA